MPRACSSNSENKLALAVQRVVEMSISLGKHEDAKRNEDNTVEI